jgi:hypothetical protein
MTENIYELITAFIEENKNATMCRAKWLYTEELEVFVRLTRHAINGKLERCFDIANVSSI